MRKFLKSLACALRGICLALRTERNFRIQIVALCLTVILGIYLGLSAVEWALVIIAIGFVLTAELFNTALEKLGNEVAGGKQRELIRRAKDISAGAVLLAAVTAFAIGVIVLFIPFIRLLI